jgi:hypothetical protein
VTEIIDWLAGGPIYYIFPSETINGIAALVALFTGLMLVMGREKLEHKAMWVIIIVIFIPIAAFGTFDMAIYSYYPQSSPLISWAGSFFSLFMAAIVMVRNNWRIVKALQAFAWLSLSAMFAAFGTSTAVQAYSAPVHYGAFWIDMTNMFQAFEFLLLVALAVSFVIYLFAYFQHLRQSGNPTNGTPSDPTKEIDTTATTTGDTATDDESPWGPAPRLSGTTETGDDPKLHVA